MSMVSTITHRLAALAETLTNTGLRLRWPLAILGGLLKGAPKVANILRWPTKVAIGHLSLLLLLTRFIAKVAKLLKGVSNSEHLRASGRAGRFQSKGS